MRMYRPEKKPKGKCPTEIVEQRTFVNQVRLLHPDTWGRLLVHVPNEDTHRDRHKAAERYADGMSKGASDIIIPGCPAFVCEFKRANGVPSDIRADQMKYLQTAAATGSFACVAFGWEQAILAFNDWLALLPTNGVDQAP